MERSRLDNGVFRDRKFWKGQMWVLLGIAFCASRSSYPVPVVEADCLHYEISLMDPKWAKAGIALPNLMNSCVQCFHLPLPP